MKLLNLQEYKHEYPSNIKLLICTAFLLLGFGCNQNTSGPGSEEFGPGAVEVIVETSGPDQDRDGYTVNIDLEKTIESATNDTLLLEGIEQGSRQIGLVGLDNECSVQGENPQTVSIITQDTAQTSFDVQCEEVVLTNKIVYRHCDGICDGLYIMDSDGTNPKQLTTHSWDSDPIISPDGTKVAFVNGVRNPDVSEHHNEIYIIDASGYPITRIPRPAESLHDDDPSWSPDGTKLLFVQSNSNSSGTDIYSVNVDGTDRTRITNDKNHDSWPLYTPDGSQIIFYSLNRPYNTRIFKMNADGSNITPIGEDDISTHHLALSNDGSMVAFEVEVQEGPQQIYVMNTDGTGIRPVTSDSSGYAFASWSPDDKQLIFYNFDTSDIFRINIDGTGLTNLTNTPGLGETDPYWSPVE